MIRTRDLVVFVAILFVLFVGIAITLLQDKTEFQKEMMTFFTTAEENPEYTAESPQTEESREDVITRLRNALAQHSSDVEPSPSVEESEESVSEEDIGTVASAGVTYCATYDDTQNVVRNWPLSGLAFSVAGGYRSLEHTEASSAPKEPQPASEDQSASTSVPFTPLPENEVATLLRIPVSPVGTGEHCIPGEVIGVTVSGSLMYNSEVAFYRGYGPDYLIGYARDGFPIYGYYEGEIDTCGGYMHPSGYRYAITPDREYVLGCFAGAPASFMGF